jgi:excisionase family DNA binding protein
MSRTNKNPNGHPGWPSFTPRLFDVRAACFYLGIGRSQLYNLMGEGKLVPVKIGKRVLFDRTDLDRFVDKLKSKSDTSQ